MELVYKRFVHKRVYNICISTENTKQLKHTSRDIYNFSYIQSFYLFIPWLENSKPNGSIKYKIVRHLKHINAFFASSAELKQVWVCTHVLLCSAVSSAFRCHILLAYGDSGHDARMGCSSGRHACTCLNHVTSYTSAGVHIGENKKRNKTHVITAFNVRGSPVSGDNLPHKKGLKLDVPSAESCKRNTEWSWR
jgi:hypothetical protein